MVRMDELEKCWFWHAATVAHVASCHFMRVQTSWSELPFIRRQNRPLTKGKEAIEVTHEDWEGMI